MKKINQLLLAIISVITISFSGCSNNKKDSNDIQTYEVKVKEFNKHGNVILDTTFDNLKEKNVEVMDIVTLNIGSNSYDVPIGTEYSDVNSGNMICRFDLEDNKVILAVNGGNFATTTNMAVKETITESPGYKWNVSIDKVIFSLKEKCGYKDEYTLRHLTRSNVREDYSNLNDDEYANCRVINTTGIKNNILYRGTTPLDEDMIRNTYAMAFISKNNVKSIINLTNTVEEMMSYSSYTDSYYSTCKIANIVMDYDFISTNFAIKVKECVKFINENDGPYYFHCKEGKDRTGMLASIIECYFGASYQEVVDDYMKTYINFFKVEKDSETYNIVLKTNLEKVLCNIFDINNLKDANLKLESKEFLLKAGLTENDLNTFESKIGELE